MGKLKHNPEMGETALQPKPAKQQIHPYPGYVSFPHSVPQVVSDGISSQIQLPINKAWEVLWQGGPRRGEAAEGPHSCPPKRGIPAASGVRKKGEREDGYIAVRTRTEPDKP